MSSNLFVHKEVCFKFARSLAQLAYGVIGNTAGFGPVVLGSSPSRPTEGVKTIPMLNGVGIFY